MLSNSSISNLVSIPVTALVVIIFIFSLYITIKYRSTEQYKNTRLNVFFSTLASVAIIFVGLNIILTSISFEHNQFFSRLTKTKEAVDKLWLYPNELLISSKNIRPEFLAGFFMNNPELYNLALRDKKETKLTLPGIVEEQFIANVMVQSWEDCLSIHNYDYDNTPLKSWLKAFLTWAQNPYFKFYYERIKFEYRNSTITLGDLLFEYAAKIPVPTKNTKIYDQIVEELMNDPRFLPLKVAIS